MNYLSSIRPDAEKMLQQYVHWEPAYEGAMVATWNGCTLSDRVLENLFDRRVNVLSGAALILIGIVVIAAIGSLWGGIAILAIGFTAVAISLLLQPNLLSGHLYVHSWLVEILGQEKIKQLPILPKGNCANSYPFALQRTETYVGHHSLCSVMGDGTEYLFQYKIQNGDSSEIIIEGIGAACGIDPEIESSRRSQTQIAKPSELAYLGQKHIIFEELGAHTLPVSQMYSRYSQERLLLCQGQYQRRTDGPIVERITSLLNGEKVGILNERWEAQPVTESSYLQLI